jgi:hypothetical protein
MSERRPGWNVPKPERIPRPTVWPAAMSLAIAFFAWGLVTSPVVLGVGFALFVVSLGGWLGEIRHEHRKG